MRYFLNGGRNERFIVRHPRALELYKELSVSRLLLIPYAIVEDEWQQRWHDDSAQFQVPGLTARSITTLDTDHNLIAEAIKWADFIYLPGGSQKTLLRRLNEFEAIGPLRKAFESATLKLIGGGSAGAMVMGSHCIVGHTEVKEVVPGLDFLTDSVIDSHFSNRNRQERLRDVLAQHPTLTGIGLDEDTAVVLNDRQEIESVFGAGTISVYQGSQKKIYDS